MGTLLLHQIKRQASSYLHGKYQNARLAFSDVTRAELLAEEATSNGDHQWVPDTKTMTTIAEASFNMDDYWRIVDVLHKRFESVDWKEWRRSYKSLVLLEFLLTHGPEEIAREFQCDIDVILELGTFQHKDENGFNWGTNMRKRSDRVIKLLSERDTLKEARLKALKITKGIQGFGSLKSSTTLSSPDPPPSSDLLMRRRHAALRTCSLPLTKCKEMSELNKHEHISLISNQDARDDDEDHSTRDPDKSGISSDQSSDPAENTTDSNCNKVLAKESEEELEDMFSRIWDCPKSNSNQEKGWLLEAGAQDNYDNKIKESGAGSEGFISGIVAAISPKKKGHAKGEEKDKVGAKSFSDFAKMLKKKYDRQFSMGY